MNIFKRLMAFLYGKSREYYYERRYITYKKNYSISQDFGFNGTDIRITGEGNLITGSNSYVGSYSTFQLAKGCKISIGNKCQISHNVRMYTSSDISDQDFLSENRLNKSGNIIINDGVWIGANVFIVPGISIGENSIIGANSVVTKDIPANCISGGIPCKVIKIKSIGI